MKILVVEDKFVTVAKNALAQSGYEIVFAEDYETALAVLNAGGVDCVLTDLFFPGERDWGEYWQPALARNAEYVKCHKAFWEGEAPPREHVSHPAFWFPSMYLLKMENPSGLGILLECHRRKIPCLIISDTASGGRHSKSLGAVRCTMTYLEEFNFETEGTHDPLPKYLFKENSVDKNDPNVWIEALAQLVFSMSSFMEKMRAVWELTRNCQASTDVLVNEEHGVAVFGTQWSMDGIGTDTIYVLHKTQIEGLGSARELKDHLKEVVRKFWNSGVSGRCWPTSIAPDGLSFKYHVTYYESKKDEDVTVDISHD